MQNIGPRTVICLAILIGPAATAQEICVEPAMPARLDGNASADRMRAALAEARHFIAQSGLYQDCLLREVEAVRTQAAASGQPFEPMIETSARLKIAASRKAQEKVGAAVNGAITAARQPPR